jgi:hypothetical protein
MTRSGARTLASLEAAVAAGEARIARANRYPEMRVRPVRGGFEGVTITGTEYVMSRGEMVALVGMLGAGIARVGGQ